MMIGRLCRVKMHKNYWSFLSSLLDCPMPDLPVTWLLCLLLAIAIAVSRYRERSFRRGLPLPPGPKPLSLVGMNLFDKQQESPWITYRNWSKQYGELTISREKGHSH